MASQYHDCYPATDPRTNAKLQSSAKGKVVMVTGAGRGIGRSIAQFFAYAHAEALILIALEQNEVESVAVECRKISNVKTKCIGMDVTRTDLVHSCIQDTISEFSRIDVLCCNAGIPPQFLSVADSDPVIWWRVMEVHVKHTFDFTHFVLPHMQKQKGGRIIYTCSTGAHANTFVSSYILAKLSISRLSEIVHREAYEDNVRCFNFHPGSVPSRFLTDFQDRVKGEDKVGSYAHGDTPDQLKSAQNAVQFLQPSTIDKPEMAAGLVVWLASGQGDFMSGRFVDATVDVQYYVDNQEKIKSEDLWRVRLCKGDGVFVPVSEY